MKQLLMKWQTRKVVRQIERDRQIAEEMELEGGKFTTVVGKTRGRGTPATSSKHSLGSVGPRVGDPPSRPKNAWADLADDPEYTPATKFGGAFC